MSCAQYLHSRRIVEAKTRLCLPDAEITDIWCAPEALTRIRDYVARTLKKR